MEKKVLVYLMFRHGKSTYGQVLPGHFTVDRLWYYNINDIFVYAFGSGSV